MKRNIIALTFLCALMSCGEADEKSVTNNSDDSNNDIVIVVNNAGTNNQTTPKNQTVMTTNTVPVADGCGDSVLGTDEECEGFELRGNPCASIRFEGGGSPAALTVHLVLQPVLSAAMA